LKYSVITDKTNEKTKHILKLNLYKLIASFSVAVIACFTIIKNP